MSTKRSYILKQSCRFVYACMTFLWISDIKGLTIFEKLFILDICGGPDYASVTFCYLCCVKSGVRKVSIPKDNDIFRNGNFSHTRNTKIYRQNYYSFQILEKVEWKNFALKTILHWVTQNIRVITNLSDLHKPANGFLIMVIKQLT